MFSALRHLSGLVFFCLLLTASAFGQNGSVKGVVKNDLNEPVEDLVVEVEGTEIRTKTDATGRYEISLKPGTYTLVHRHPGYKQSKKVVEIRPGATTTVYPQLINTTTADVIIQGSNDPKNPIQDDPFQEVLPIDPKKMLEMTSMKSDVTSRLQTMGFVSTNNEFSSQYRTRGGNYDENLIYVNDIEIYRPFLVRTGQQEGLGFLNAQLVDNITFSAGGFQAKYGDKLSSVLDVDYRTPKRFAGSAELGVLNQNLHLEGVVQKRDSTAEENGYTPGRLTILTGARRFTPSYVLNSLDTKGEYKPVFYDGQVMLNYIPKQKQRAPRIRERKNGETDTIYIPQDRLRLTALGTFALNDYIFTPQTRETSFGTIQKVFKLRVAFEGQEISTYQTEFGALMLEHRVNTLLRFKYIFSAFHTLESETFDVEGGYFLSDVNTNFGSEGFNEVVFDRGIGTFFRHGRNFLEATVMAGDWIGTWFPNKNQRHKITFGLRAQQQIIQDELLEWNGIDSAGYFTLEESFRGTADLQSRQYKAFVQDQFKLSADGTKQMVLGARAIYNDLNGEFLVAPRAQFMVQPRGKISLRDIENPLDSSYRFQLRFAAGIYQQPAFYREMRAFDGSLRTDLPAQASLHFIAGGNYLFFIWNRPFKVTGELYYKQLTSLVPYEIENVRIRYYPFNSAVGYAAGMDARIAGQFIQGVESWLSMGLLRTQEKIDSLDQGYVPRPSDQRLTFGMYFQDEIPGNNRFKANINFVYGSGLRFGPNGVIENRTVFKAPSYQRVDLGFSYLVTYRTEEEMKHKWGIQSLLISAEIFNLFQRQNTVSYTWIKDVYNTQFAIPNYLSARLLNIRLLARF